MLENSPSPWLNQAMGLCAVVDIGSKQMPFLFCWTVKMEEDIESYYVREP